MPYQYRIHRFSNGVRLAVSEMPYMESVSVGFWAGVGGRHESARASGISHFVEHLMFKGTDRRSARKIAETVEGIGGYLNAFTAEDHTCYYAKADARHFDLLCDVLADMYLGANFPEPEVERERGVICEEIAMYRDQPAHYVHELLTSAMYPSHPLGRSLTGTEQTVGAMTREDLLAHRRRAYVGNSTVIVVAGKVTLEEAVAALEPRLESLERGRSPRFTRLKKEAPGRRLTFFAKETEQVHLALGCYACSRHDERRFALKLMNVLLGENMSSRLFQNLRERRGVCYSVHSAISCLSDSGLVQIYAGVDEARLEPAMRAVVKELNRLAERPPTAAEVRKARDYVIGQSRMCLESTTNRMMWLGESILGYGGVIDPETIEERMHKVTREEISRVARECLTPSRRVAALIGPEREVAKLEAALGA